MRLATRQAQLVVVLAVLLAILALPASAGAACVSSTPGEWTFEDPSDAQDPGTEIHATALHVKVDATCRLSMWVDVSGEYFTGGDPPAYPLTFYDIDVDGGEPLTASVQVPREPFGITLGYPDASRGIGYWPQPHAARVGAHGFSAPLDILRITRPGMVQVRTTFSWDRVPESGAFSFPLAFLGEPINAAAPTVAGSAEKGAALACVEGSWSGAAPIGFGYRWLRDGVAIPGASSRTYVTADHDVGRLVACEVTATGPGGVGTVMSAGLAITDRTPPRLSRLGMRPAAFRAAPRGGSIATGRPRGGTSVKFRLQEPATVSFTVQRLRGRRRPVTLPGAFRLTGKGGSNAFTFTGRHRGRALAAGAYRLVAAPRDAAGNLGTPARIAFRIVR